MIYRELGSTGILGSVFELGTFQASLNSEAEKAFYEIFEYAIDHGVNTIDTAQGYGDGKSEFVVGDVLRSLDREKFYIISKVQETKLHAADVRKSVENGLRRIGSDYFDIYCIHLPNPDVALSETADELMQLKKEGKIRHIGVSNFNRYRLERISEICEIEYVQNGYNMLWRWGQENEIIPFCLAHNIAFAAYSPLGQGILTGRYNYSVDRMTLGHKQNMILYSEECFTQCLKVTEQVIAMAKKYGKKPSEIALNWLVKKPGLSAIVLGGTKVSQIQENMEALHFEMEKSDYDYLDCYSKKITDEFPHDFSMWLNHKMKDEQML